MTTSPNASEVHYDEILTNVSIAFDQGQDDYIAGKIFGVIPVDKQSDAYYTSPRGSRLRAYDTLRAPGTESKGGGWELSDDAYYAKVYSFHKDLTREDLANQDEVFNLKQEATEFTTDVLLRDRDLRAAKTWFGAGIWDHDVTGGATAGANAFVQFDRAGSDPVKTLRALINEQQNASGKRPNKLVLGRDLADALEDHSSLVARFQYTSSDVVGLDMIAKMLHLDEILVSRAVFNAAPEGSADDIQPIFDPKSALLTMAPKTVGKKSPTGGAVFAWTGLLNGGAFGGSTGEIEAPLKRSVRVETDMAYAMKVTAPEAGTFLKNAVQ